MQHVIPPGPGQEAQLRYLDSDFEIEVSGTFVTCAVTGARILLDDLRYWSVDRQEPYADAAASVEAYRQALKNGEAF